MDQSTTLYFRRGGSDKVYRLSLAGRDGGYVVLFEFGRRGATPQAGTKTPAPVPYARAKAIFDRLVKEKLAKGYAPGEGGAPCAESAGAGRDTGVLPQLLNPVGEEEAGKLLADPAWGAQEKFDGRRMLVRKEGESVGGINRRGLAVALPETVAREALALPGDFLLDGEAVGERLFAFDLPEIGGQDIRPAPYRDRHARLADLLAHGTRTAIRPAGLARTEPDKRALLARLRAREAEGIVFKRLDAPYVPGRPNSGGDQRKLKFVSTASCIANGRLGARRSTALLLHGPDGELWEVGNVAVPANHPVPESGDVVEIRYLYAYRGGALFQPVYMGKREDIAPRECTLAQLKFKAEPEEEDAA